MHHAISFILRFAYAAGFCFILLFHTEEIYRYVPQLLGGLIMLEAVGQLLELLLLKLKTKVHIGFFITPLIIILYALYLLFFGNAEISADTTIREVFGLNNHSLSYTKLQLQFGGFCFLAFMVSEIVISCLFFMPLYRPEKFEEQRRIKAEAEKLNQEKQAEALKAAEEKKINEVKAEEIKAEEK